MSAPKPGRPLIGSKKRQRVSFTLHPDDASWLKSAAGSQHISSSTLVELLIHQAQMADNEPAGFKPSIRIPIPHAQIQDFCKKHNVNWFALFGSVLTKDFSQHSDIDILVKFAPNHQPGFYQLTTLEKELGRIFKGYKIDLKTPNELSRYFRNEVLKEAKVIYAA